MSNDAREFILSPLSNTKMVAVFIVNCFRLKCSLCLHSSINRKTILTSHISVYLDCEGFRWKMVLINLLINGCFNISLISGI